MTAWKPKEIRTLSVLWTRGVPAPAIGARLRRAPHVVVAKANRLGLAPRSRSGALRRQTSRVAPPLPMPAPRGVPFLDTAPHHCRYIVGGEGMAALCCGLPRAYDTAWCAFHCEVCFTPEGLEHLIEKAARRDAAQRHRNPPREEPFSSAQSLSRESNQLKIEVDRFMATVRAA